MRPVSTIRCTLGISCPLVLGAVLGQPALGVLAALGAIYSGLASFRGSYRHRLAVMAATSLMTATVTLLGCYLSPHPAVAVFVVPAVAFLFGLVSAGGPAANTLSIQGTAILVVIAGIQSAGKNPLGNAGLVLAGGLFQTVLLLPFWPFYGRVPERKAVAAAFASLARFARDITDGGNPSDPGRRIPVRDVFQLAWETVDQTSKRTPDRLDRVLTDAEAIRAALAGLARACINAEPTQDQVKAIRDIAAELDTIAQSIRRGQGLGPAESAPANQTPSLPDDRPESWIEFINSLIVDVRRPSPPLGPEAAPISFADIALFNLFGSAELRSLSVKHAARYAIAVGAAVGLSHAWGFDHAYWLPLTVSLTLRSDYGSTLDRSITRVVGTLVGVAMAEGLLSLFHPGFPFLIGMTIVGGTASFALYLANYALYSVGITFYVIGAISAAAPHAPRAGLGRLESTVAGAAVAILMNLLAPIWQSRQVKTVLCESIEAHIAFGERVLHSLSGPSDPKTLELQRRARALHIEAERVVNAAEHEPRWSHERQTFDPDEILARLDDGAAVLLALYAAMGGSGAGGPSSSNIMSGNLTPGYMLTPSLNGLVEQARDAMERIRGLLVRLEAA